MGLRLVTIAEHTFLDLLHIESVVVDLGMNEGWFARTVRREFHCRIFGCEPTPRLAKEFDWVDGIVCEPVAVAERNGTAIFYIDQTDPTASSLDPANVAPGQPSLTVPTVTLESFAAKHNLDKIDILKVDVEGAELRILETIDPAWLQQHVKQMSVEFHLFRDRSARPRIEAIRKKLRKAGFYSIDFSRSYMDVLFLNTHQILISPRTNMQLVTAKYIRAARRRALAALKRLLRPILQF